MQSPLKRKILDVYGREPEDLDQLADCVKAMISHRLRTVEPDVRLIGFAWDISSKIDIAPTHNAPQGCAVEFSRPTSRYPGFTGRVWVRFSSEPSGFGSDLLSPTLTYPGTGGSGTYRGPWAHASRVAYALYTYTANERMSAFSWDYKFYLQDWPGVQELVEHARLAHMLRHGDTVDFKMAHKYCWEAEELKAADLVCSELYKQMHNH